MTQPTRDPDQPVQTDNRPQPEDGPQDDLSQDPTLDYDEELQ